MMADTVLRKWKVSWTDVGKWLALLSAAESRLRGHRDMAWSMADQMLVSGVTFLTGLAFARVLGIGEFGKCALVLLLSAQAMTVQDYILNAPMMTLAGRRAGRSRRYFASVAYLNALGALVSALVVASIVAMIFLARDGTVSIGLLAATGLVTAAQNLHSAFRRALFAQGSGRDALAFDAARYLSLVAIAATVWAFGSVDTASAEGGLFLIAFTAGLPVVIASLLWAWPRPDRRLLGAILFRHWQAGRWLALVVIVAMGQEQAIPIIVSLHLGDAAVGGLRAAVTLLGVTHFIMMAVSNFVPQRAIRASDADGAEGLRAYLVRETLVLSVPTIGFIAVIAIPAGFWLETLFGPQYAAYATVLRICCLSYALIFVRELWIHYLRTVERTRAVFEAFLLSSVVALTLAFAALRAFGVEGAAGAMLVGNLISTVYVLAAVRRDHRAARIGEEPPQRIHNPG